MRTETDVNLRQYGLLRLAGFLPILIALVLVVSWGGPGVAPLLVVADVLGAGIALLPARLTTRYVRRFLGQPPTAADTTAFRQMHEGRQPRVMLLATLPYFIGVLTWWWRHGWVTAGVDGMAAAVAVFFGAFLTQTLAAGAGILAASDLTRHPR